MKILFAALKYDYGIPERGYSFEYYSFYDTLVGMGHDVEYFDFYSLYRQLGSLEMTKSLRRKVEEWKPDLLFMFLFSDQFDFDELKKIKYQTKTITYNWFADDHWRFDNYSRHWAPCFSFISTTDKKAIHKYQYIGYSNVLLTQWAANPRIWKPTAELICYDVTFIGQAHGNRKQVINTLRNNGLNIQVWGPYWNVTRLHKLAKKLHFITNKTIQMLVDRTRLSQEEMIKILCQSRINLNLSASSQTLHNQIKGRNFEIPATGGFQISGYEEGLEEYFQLDKEIVCYHTVDELINKIKYYLNNEDERLSIAKAGYKLVLSEHTYTHRFTTLFNEMDLGV